MEQIGFTGETAARVRSWRRAMVSVAFLALVVVVFTIGLNRLGHWLVVAEPLQNARAIVVLSGHLPFRAMEAATIYKAGWAPEIWLTRVSRPAKEASLAGLGVHVVGEETYNQQILRRLGVPLGKIKILKKSVQNTLDEVRVVAQQLKYTGGQRVILVTSKSHTRRVRATWRSNVGQFPRAIIRYALADPFNPDRWWRHTRDALSVSREILGLMNVWTGFPLRPDRQG